MNYKQLCIELFGTSDVEELRKISQMTNRTNNSRGAGRKRKLSDAQLDFARCELIKGRTMSDIAAELDTSVQVLGRSINKPMHDGCTMRIEYMFRNKICSIIDVDFKDKIIHLENRTDVIIHRAFGVKENPDWEDFEWFLKDRSFEQGRTDIREIIKKLGIPGYDSLSIVESVRGRTAEDNMWMKFIYRSVT